MRTRTRGGWIVEATKESRRPPPPQKGANQRGGAERSHERSNNPTATERGAWKLRITTTTTTTTTAWTSMTDRTKTMEREGMAGGGGRKEKNAIKPMVEDSLMSYSLDCYPYSFSPLLLFANAGYFDTGYSNYNAVTAFFAPALRGLGGGASGDGGGAAVAVAASGVCLHISS
jgi:hypothetical protein